jgi:c-di-GMP-binding flagellar brake protein YcgR
MSSSAPKSVVSNPDRRRRRYPRYRTDFRVSVTLFRDNSYEKIDGHCRDLSEAGIGILLAAELIDGEVASLNFTLPGTGEWTLRAVVRHRRGYQYGFEFLSFSADQKKLLAGYMKGLERAD